jgi:hypothetical protein
MTDLEQRMTTARRQLMGHPGALRLAFNR